jgi:predicted HicB family RNase H-like nuclease
MKRKAQEKSFRLVHIRLPVETHRRLRIRAAELDTTIQEWVAGTIAKELARKTR